MRDQGALAMTVEPAMALATSSNAVHKAPGAVLAL